jgi:hypothetical protein
LTSAKKKKRHLPNEITIRIQHVTQNIDVNAGYSLPYLKAGVLKNIIIANQKPIAWWY